MSEDKYKLSFIIPAWNEEALLAATITSIQQSAQNYEFEIIVADDASDDRTPEIARGMGATVVTCNNRQIGQTRNDGAAVATGGVLIFIDADTIVSPRVVVETVEAIQNGAVAGGSFPCFEENTPFLEKCLTPVIKWTFYFLHLAAGAYMFCTRDAFETAGGFNEKFYAAEEVHLSKALHKCGRFKTIKSRVVTSGRKFKSHSSFQILMTLFLVSIPGIRSIHKRKDLWYGDRKQDE